MKKFMIGLIIFISLLLCTLAVGCGGSSSDSDAEAAEIKRVDTIEQVNVNRNYISEAESFYDTDNDYHMFTMGTITDVPLAPPIFIYYDGNGEIEQSFSKTSTSVSSISTSVQSVVQKRLLWEFSAEIGASIEAGLDANAKAAISCKISGKEGAEIATTETNSYSEFMEWTNSLQNSVTIKFDERYKAGYYAYVVSATIKVRTVLAKNRMTETMNIGSYSELLAFGYSFAYNEFEQKLAINDNQNFEFNLGDVGDLSNPTNFVDVNGEYTKIANTQEFNEINEDLNGKYVIVNDLNFNGERITPIGADAEFTGVIMGCGHIIENFSIAGNYSKVGLIARNAGIIENIHVRNASVSANCIAVNAIVGVVVGENSGRISGCLVSNSSVEARAIDSDNTENSSRYAIVGGVVGKISSGSLKNCLVDKVSIYGYAKKHDKAWSNGWEEAAYVFAGGVVGEYVRGVVINNTTNSLTKLEGSAEYRGNAAFVVTSITTRSRICLGGIIGRQSDSRLAQSGNICKVSKSDFEYSFKSYNSTNDVKPIEEYKLGDIVGFVG